MSRAPDGTYYVTDGEDPSPWVTKEHLTNRVLPFLKHMRRLRIWERWTPTYEDLFYVVSQIEQYEGWPPSNPALRPLANRLHPIMNEFCAVDKEAESFSDNWEYWRLTGEALNYINDVVWRLLLAVEPGDLGYLKMFKDLAKSRDISGADLFTLNHDTVLEQYFDTHRIAYVDGFAAPNGDIGFWEPERLDKTNCRMLLYKLHGSVNWFLFRDKAGAFQPGKVRPGYSKSLWQFTGPDGEYVRPPEGRPAMLTGTGNKPSSYIGGFYADLFYRFRYKLARTNTLVVCGYGFRDAGINSQIREWLGGYEKRTLIVIDKSLDTYHKRSKSIHSRAELPRLLSFWSVLHQSILIPKGIEDLTWDDIKTEALDM